MDDVLCVISSILIKERKIFIRINYAAVMKKAGTLVHCIHQKIDNNFKTSHQFQFYFIILT